MKSWRDGMNVVIAIALLAFIGFNILRLGMFVVQYYNTL